MFLHLLFLPPFLPTQWGGEELARLTHSQMEVGAVMA